MTSIYDIPYDDIKIFLSANDKNIKNIDDDYKLALNLLKDKKTIGHTTSIIEWMIAHNLLIDKVDIPIFNIYDIDNMSQVDINQLAKLLTMKGNNSDNIKNILRFLNKLDDKLSFLPEINNLISDKLDYLLQKDIISFTFEQIILLFENYYDKKTMRFLIYKNMENIMTNNIVITNNHKNFSNIDLDRLIRFIINFLDKNEISIAKRILNVVKNKLFHPYWSGYNFLFRVLFLYILDKGIKEVIENYIKLIDNEVDLYDSLDSAVDFYITRYYIKLKDNNPLNFFDTLIDFGTDFKYATKHYDIIYNHVLEYAYIPYLESAIKLEKYGLIVDIIRSFKYYEKDYIYELSNQKLIFFTRERENIKILTKKFLDLIIEIDKLEPNYGYYNFYSNK